AGIETTFKDGKEFTEEEIEKMIEEIVGWLDLPETLSRGQVIERLDKMGIDPEKPLPGDREGIADRLKYTDIDFSGWGITDTLDVSIGQGTNAYTPIQMANFIATLANGG